MQRNVAPGHEFFLPDSGYLPGMPHTYIANELILVSGRRSYDFSGRIPDGGSDLSVEAAYIRHSSGKILVSIARYLPSDLCHNNFQFI